ncbi:hypothetical protein HUB98_24445 [Paenibacillus barcinonensis]|uniref:DUF4435 domain-containing protein n=1 Tax=Paenibacillus barcinonensis TaxID=198119 RepID=A0A2V4VNL5_PAEBA|nr:hypothetical protein [Paenibacillus barcinonensis]PYE47864.1 hypothetical protein DFQ00_111163 [Paenibacillus barcinonensis]QKS59047.1 hypothetical protein HUB98_24445 [Paenibacillus barcinonensis]
MSNSVRSNLTKEDIVSEIKLSIGADINKEITYLIVEGSDDIKFWKSMSNDSVVILESFSGKNGIREIITQYFDNVPQVIGIRDKDYENESVHKRIFYYDHCCMEMMFISRIDVFNSIYSEYFEENLPAAELRGRILSQLKGISYIRKLNETKGWGIKIDGLSLNNSFNKETKELITERIFASLNLMNQNFFDNNTIEKQDIINFMCEEKEINELLDITQGHDFLKLFSIYCMREHGRSASDVNISSSLRCAYRSSDFEETILYSKLTEHEDTYGLKIVS